MRLRAFVPCYSHLCFMMIWCVCVRQSLLELISSSISSRTAKAGVRVQVQMRTRVGRDMDVHDRGLHEDEIRLR
jgi:hypothetical protein